MGFALTSPFAELLGGGLIGLAATLLWALSGRVMGISGVLSGILLGRADDLPWRAAFLGGLVGVGMLANLGAPGLVEVSPRKFFTVIVAGLLVGAGTALGKGCTSGHGVCGISRGSVRSFAATVTFIATGVATVAVVRWLELSL